MSIHNNLFSQDNNCRAIRLRGEGGFTFPELLVSLCILAIAACFAMPNLSRTLENYRLKATSRQLVTDLQLAKMKAVGSKTEYRVTFDNTNNRYSIEQGNSFQNSTAWTQTGVYRNFSDKTNPYYARGVTFNDGFTGHRVIFSPMGQASETASATFSTAHYTKNVAVAFTGRICIN
jgi:prepilin-type N-terminal cleavage/methylation domain-containing protein